MTLDDMRNALGREEPIEFTPVPRLRNRRNGWDEKTQKDFIAALSLCGSVRAAAEAVGGRRPKVPAARSGVGMPTGGRSPRSAYKLLDAPGADDFARAWDEALDTGLTETAKRESGSPRSTADLGGQHSVNFVTFRAASGTRQGGTYTQLTQLPELS